MYGSGWWVEGFANFLEFLLGPVDPGTGARRSRSAPVPDVRGFDLDDARRLLAAEGFEIEVHRLEEDPAPVMGIVVAQLPAPGTTLRRGRSVSLSVLHPPRLDREGAEPASA